MDMHFKWLLNREQQGQFKIYWKPGKMNLANHFMKHHLLAHHQIVQQEFSTQVVEHQETAAGTLRFQKKIYLEMKNAIGSMQVCRV